MKSFKELIRYAKKKGKKRCVVTCAEDESVLEGIKLAQDLDLISPVLVGNKDKIMECARRVGLKDIDVKDATDEQEAIRISTSSVRNDGDLLMKGLTSTSAFLKGVLNKDWGLRTGKILSHIAVLEIPHYHKLIFSSDGGMNPRLDLNLRIDIINNAIAVMKAIGLTKPKIGMVAASETVHPDMPETVDAEKILALYKKGEIRDAIIEGPFGFDVAISRDSAAHKRIKSEVSGDVDFLLMPNISAANIWAKGLIYLAKAKAAGIVAGAARPIVMLSRADTPETKLNSIALGVALS
jgi:phosphate butyryltransferase